MSFVPAIPLGGYAGWAFLKRTEPVQKAAFDRQPMIQRDEAYFRENIGKITSAEDLVADRRLLRVALGAFGLDGDINNRFFIRKVLEEGTLSDGALAVKLSDRRYRDLSAAFGLDGVGAPLTAQSDFADRMLARWKDRQFEAAVGNVNDSMRLAMNARREIATLAGNGMSEDARWFTLMGQPPLRQVLETAFGLPASFGVLDIDQQKQVLDAKVTAAFGEGGVAQFADPDRLEGLLRRYLVRAQSGSVGGGTSSGHVALALLSNTLRPLR